MINRTCFTGESFLDRMNKILRIYMIYLVHPENLVNHVGN